ncbi:MAG: DUF2779 domain-containing protein [Coriobacteriia bacterium]|nr:DUF2779 domain-containing protein [Coriobacteriia bacterium]
MSTRLSKSRFQKGLQCPRALWLSVHEPTAAALVTESKQWIFDQGTEVGRLAQQLFGGGTEVAEDYRHQREALETTKRLLEGGASILYEPAFYFDDVLVRVDVLVKVGDAWDLYEVKSTSKVKPEHVTDVAVQTYVVEGCGLTVRRSCIVHLDTSYVYEGGEYDLSALFAVEDVTAQARAFMPAVPGLLESFRTMLDGPEPDVRVGAQCTTPYECDFSARCHAFMPAEHPITNLPRLSEGALHALLDLGITSIRDIPDDFSGLTPTQAETVAAVKKGEPLVQRDGLAEALSALEWPVYHLDFETINPALPLWPGTRPYQVIPFQYSIHVQQEDGTYEHREYLHTGGTDPRRLLTERMLADLAETGSVTHYTSFERQRLERLATAFPDLAKRINAVIGRLFDLEPVIKQFTTHPDACGRTSIKYVLPAWCPDMSYAGLEIGDGQTASVRYTMAVRGMLSAEEIEKLYADLLIYCGQDTFAMVRLLERLREECG